MSAGLVVSLCWLAVTGAAGILVLRRLPVRFDRLELVAFGVPLGVVAASLATFYLACATGLSLGVIILVTAASGAAALLTLDRQDRSELRNAARRAVRLARSLPSSAGFYLPKDERYKARSKSRNARMPTAAPAGVGAGATIGAVPLTARTEAAGVRGARRKVLRPVESYRRVAAGIAAGARANAIPIAVLAGFTLLWAAFCHDAISFRADGLWVATIRLWQESAIHLGQTSAFVYGNNFPPTNPFVAGQPLNTHYLTEVTAAIMQMLGLDVAGAFNLQSFLFLVLITLGVYAFARRLTRDSTIASVTCLLFLLGGGLGWLITVGNLNASHDLLQTLVHQPWDARNAAALNFSLETVPTQEIISHRAYLYGLPLGMFVLTCLYIGIETGEPWLYVAAGIAAGLLPLVHLGSLLALALLTPFLFLLFPSRTWAWYFLYWTALAVPQLIFQQGGIHPSATHGAHWVVGWVAAPDSAVWFWLKNLGLFLPLLGFALLSPTCASGRTKRFLWAFMPVFLIANVYAFQILDWDNIQLFTYWFLGGSVLVAGLLVQLWRLHDGAVVRTLLAAVVLSLTLSGVLLHASRLLGDDAWRLASPDDIELAAQVRARTAPEAVFAVGTEYDQPVAMLAGRRTLETYDGWMLAWGVQYDQLERDVQSIYALTPNTPNILRAHHVDYVLVGPVERSLLHADAQTFAALYPKVIDTGTYQVFAVGAGGHGG